MCWKSIKSEAVFTETELNNEWNINFLQYSPLPFNKHFQVSFTLFRASLKHLDWYIINLCFCTYLKCSTPLNLFSLGNKKSCTELEVWWVWRMLHSHNSMLHEKLQLKKNWDWLHNFFQISTDSSRLCLDITLLYKLLSCRGVRLIRLTKVWTPLSF